MVLYVDVIINCVCFVMVFMSSRYNGTMVSFYWNDEVAYCGPLDSLADYLEAQGFGRCPPQRNIAGKKIAIFYPSQQTFPPRDIMPILHYYIMYLT